MALKSIRKLLLFLLIGMIGVPSLWGAPAADTTQAPYFELTNTESDSRGSDTFPLKATFAEIEINGVVAEVTVRQTYANQGQVPINARYVFPAGTRAAVHGLTMTIGEAVVKAAIKEKNEARQTYEQAKAGGQSASLLTQQRPNVFQMEVANILPGDEVIVELVYSERLTITAGIYEFVFPTVVGPRYSRETPPAEELAAEENWIPSPYHANSAPRQSTFDLKARIAGGLPLSGLTSPSHNIEAQWDDPNTARIHLANKEGQPQGDRDLILRYGLAGEAVAGGLLFHEGTEESVFMLMVQPPQRVAPASIPAREFIFVVDVSGSMHGFPLDVAKILMERLLGKLSPGDQFNVVLFAGGSQVLAHKSLPADAAHRQLARNFIDGQTGGGGTELLAALKKALALPRTTDISRSVVLISDGYISAERELFDYIRSHLDQTNIFSFGIGSSVNRYLIEGVARAGQGEPFVAINRHQAQQQAGRFIEYVRQPVLSGIEVQFEGFDAYDTTPAKLPDLLAQRPLVLMGKWRGPVQGRVRITATGGEGPFEQVIDLEEFSTQTHHSALPYLWARDRLLMLSDYAPRRKHSDHRAEITQLGLMYNLLTAYTSFVAVLEQPRQLTAPAQDVDQPLPLPQGVSELAVGGPLVAGTEPGLLLLGTILSLLAGLTALVRKQRA